MLEAQHVLKEVVLLHVRLEILDRWDIGRFDVLLYHELNVSAEMIKLLSQLFQLKSESAILNFLEEIGESTLERLSCA